MLSNFLGWIELLSGRQYNKSVDVYAFGILLWELFHKSVPFCMLDSSEIRDRVLSGARPPVSLSVPTVYASLIRRAWYVSILWWLYSFDCAYYYDFTFLLVLLIIYLFSILHAMAYPGSQIHEIGPTSQRLSTYWTPYWHLQDHQIPPPLWPISVRMKANQMIILSSIQAVLPLRLLQQERRQIKSMILTLSTRYFEENSYQ